MRYEDASQAGSITTGSEPIARPDVETLPQNSNGPGSGNAISGLGTSTGASGADQIADTPGTIVELSGAGGAAAANGNGFEAPGQYGTLSMDVNGNFNYVRTTAAEGVQDVFQYTLADAKGARSSTTLTVEIPRVIDEQAIVNLPAGVEMSDIRVVGRDLIIQMPDGTQMVIPGGAVFVPDLSIGDVQIPPSNLAALLIDSEPQPAAGPPQSSGGNFADDVPPLDPGVPLGDLIPPTELDYTPPEYEDPMEIVDREPTIIIITPDNPAGAVNATASVDESGLPERNGEPEGTLEAQNIETTTGTIVFTAEDGLETITINGEAVTAVGQQIEGAHGVLTITSIDLETGEIGYSYTVTDNTTDGVDDFDDFTVVVTDDDGDVATGTLHINIADDEPIARDDTDQTDNQTGQATGNVMTGLGTTSGLPGADTVGADNATLTAVEGEGGSDSTYDSNGNLVVDGEFGTLTIDAEGNYTYVLFDTAPGGSVDVFTYTLTDGDGDAITATLTITNPDSTPTAGSNPVVQLDDDALAGGNPAGTNDDPNSVNATGTLSGSGGDGDLTFDLLTTGAPTGFTYVDGPNGSILVQQVQDSVTVTVLTITVDPETGEYTVVQNANILHPDGQTENNVVFTINYTVTDADGDVVASTLTVNVDDDTPLANNDTDTLGENDTQATGNVITGVGTNQGAGNADSPGADGFAGITALVGANSSDSNGADGFEVDGAFGTLTMDANGNYTYTRDPEANEGGTDVFTYTYVDGDGDTVSATLTIIVPDINSEPQIGTPENLTVDEDGLATANGDEGQTDPDEDDHGGNVTDSGVVTVDYGNDQPTNLADSIEFINPASLDGQLTQGGEPIIFSIDGSGNLIGQVNGVGPAVVTIAFTTIVDGAGGLVTYGYQVTLSGPVDQAYPNGDQDEDGIILAGVQFQVTDSDNETDTGSFNVTIFDDVPSADDFEVTQSPEDSNIVVDITVGLEAGADGVDLADVTYDVTSGNAANLSYNSATGEFAYDPDPGEEGDVIFTYTVVDGDGDEVTQTVTIHLAGDTIPSIESVENVTVDEDGLDDANEDEAGLQDDPEELDANEDADVTGEIEVDYGNDLPGDVDGAIALVDNNSLDGQLTSLDGDPIIFALEGDDLVGRADTDNDGVGDGDPLVVISIVAGATTNGTTVTYTYQVQLLGPIQHTLGDDTEASVVLTGVDFQVTDSDGSTADGSFDVTIYDDVPSATDEAEQSAGEGDTVTGTFDFVEGADGASVTHINDTALVFDDITGWSQEIDLGDGSSIIVKADGSYEFTAGDPTLGTPSITGTFTVTDGDGDQVDAGFEFDVTDDYGPTASSPTAWVDDDGFPTGNPDSVDGDHADDDLDGDGDETTYSGNLVTSFGDDLAGSVNFADMDGDSEAIGQETVTYSWDAITNTLTATITASPDDSRENTTLFTVVVTPSTGAYTVTLEQNVLHAPPGTNTENDATVTLDYNVLDSDGSSTTGVLTLNFDDDMPSDFTPVGAIVENTGTDVVTEKLDTDLTLDDNIGADQPASLAFAGIEDGDPLLDTDGNAIKVGGEPVLLYLNADGSLTATTDITDPDATVFTATLDLATSSYTIDFDRPLDNGSTSASDFTGAPAGNQDWIGIDPDLFGTPPAALDIEDTDDPNTDSVDLLITALDHSSRTATTVNRDSNDIGAGTGQANDPDETLRIDFVQDLTRDLGQDEQDPGGYNFDTHVGQKSFSFTMLDTKADNDTAVLIEAFNVNDETASKSDVTDAANNTKVAIDPATIVVKVGNTTLVQGTDYEVYPDGTGGYYLSPIPEGAVITFQAVGGVTFEAVEITNAAGHDIPDSDPLDQFAGADFAIGGFSYGVNDPGDPVAFALPVELTDADGDTSQGTIDVTVYPVGGVPTTTTTSSLMVEESQVQAELSAMSATLIPSNDNGDNGRAFVAGNQAALMGALAAAGLEMSGRLGDFRGIADDIRDDTMHANGAKQAAMVSIDGDQDQAVAFDISSQSANGVAAPAQNQDRPASAPANENPAGLDSANDDQSQQLSALAQGTDSHAAVSQAASAMTAAAVAMPSAEMVAALEAASQSVASSGNSSVAHTQEVGRVLADALTGGNGPDIGALVDAIGGGGAALEALATLHSAGASFGHAGAFGGFANGHVMLSMDALALHHDAPPA